MEGTPVVDIQATWDYWNTVEATDLTEIAGNEHDDIATMDAESTRIAHFWESQTPPAQQGTPTTETSTVYVTTFPGTGTGGTDYSSIAVLLLIMIALACALAAIRPRRRM